MIEEDYTLMNRYENELIDRIVTIRGYPERATKRESDRMKYLMRRLGMISEWMDQEEDYL